MAQRKPFRFVTLRGPEVLGRQSTPRASFDDSAVPSTPNDRGVIAGIRRLIDQGEPVDEARRRIALQFMESSDYVFRNPLWKPFLGVQSTIQALIAELRQTGRGSEFAERLDERLRQVLGPDFSLDAFLDSADFDAMHAALWHSYYANLILETQRAFDRPALVFWIRVFHLLNRIKGDGAVADLVDRFHAIRPVIPLLVAGQAPKRAAMADTAAATDATAAAHAATIANARQTIDRLRAVNLRLQRRLAEKIATPAQSESALIGDTDAETPARSGRESDPWRFSRDDLPADDQQLLAQQGVILEGQSIQSISARIDAAISRQLDRLREVSTQTLIVNVGGVLVRRKRRRAMAAAPTDDYGQQAP